MLKVSHKIVKNKMPQFKGALRREIVSVVNETAEEIFDISQQLVPVDEGDLKASGNIENYNGGELKKVVYTEDHAVPVEFGTVQSDAQPFLRPAVESAKSRLNRRLGQIQKGLGKEIGR